MLKGTIGMEPELEVKHADTDPKPVVTSRTRLAKVGTVSSYVGHGIGGDVFFEAAEDNHDHARGKSGASNDPSSDEAMSE
jgi:hypothetical protein